LIIDWLRELPVYSWHALCYDMSITSELKDSDCKWSRLACSRPRWLPLSF